jgi:hypothetical protein
MRVVASLTSTPSRLLHIEPVLSALLFQSYKLDRIYLNIPKKSRKGVPYPINLFLKRIPFQILSDQRLIVNIIDIDYGPLTKLYPALELEKEADTRIITFDDDLIPKKDCVKTLIRKTKIYPNSALSFSGWITGSGLFSYQSVTDNKIDTKVDWIQGCHGILVKREWFSDLDLLNYKQISNPVLRDLFLKHDDHWLSYNLSKIGIERIVLSGYYGNYFINTRLMGLNNIGSGIGFKIEVFYITRYLRELGYYNSKITNPAYCFTVFILLILQVLLLTFSTKSSIPVSLTVLSLIILNLGLGYYPGIYYLLIIPVLKYLFNRNNLVIVN